MVFTLVWCAAMTLAETGLMNIDEHGVNMTPPQLCINSIKIEVKFFPCVIISWKDVRELIIILIWNFFEISTKSAQKRRNIFLNATASVVLSLHRAMCLQEMDSNNKLWEWGLGWVTDLCNSHKVINLTPVYD